MNQTVIESGPRLLWGNLREAATAAAQQDPALSALLRELILDRASLAEALAHLLGHKFGDDLVPAAVLRDLGKAVMAAHPGLLDIYAADVQAAFERDPACRTYLQPFLHYKGVTALFAHRIAHALWRDGRQDMAFHLQSRGSEILQVDIHPAAELGCGLFLDHATGIVIGETSVVGDDVSIMQSVTLGGNGKERGDRHPKIGRGVLISVGAKILGNIRIGEEARVAASSVVLEDVPPHATVAGVPARIVRDPAPDAPARCMDHGFTI